MGFLALFLQKAAHYALTDFTHPCVSGLWKLTHGDTQISVLYHHWLRHVSRQFGFHLCSEYTGALQRQCSNRAEHSHLHVSGITILCHLWTKVSSSNCVRFYLIVLAHTRTHMKDYQIAIKSEVLIRDVCKRWLLREYFSNRTRFIA